MPSEKQQWAMLRPIIKQFGNAVRIENRAGLGTPDVNWCDRGGTSGWVELKHCDRWPPQGGVLQLPHFSPQQKAWIIQWYRSGGFVDVLLRVGKEWLLFDGMDAARYLGKVGKEKLTTMAVLHTQEKPTAKELKEALCRKC